MRERGRVGEVLGKCLENDRQVANPNTNKRSGPESVIFLYMHYILFFYSISLRSVTFIF